MNTTFSKEFELIKKELSSCTTMALATSYKNKVTVRSISTLYDNENIYFQTSSNLEKYSQIKNNSNVALTQGFIQIEGSAAIIGKWENNKNLLLKYCINHKKSYETYKHLPTEEVIKVEINRIKKWKYIDGVPYQIDLDIKAETITVSKQI